MRQALLIILLVFMCCSGRWCIADTADEAMAARIRQQMQSQGRDRYDALKDPGRRPVETMAAAGLRAGMTVLDVMAGSGYNTEILAAAVGPSGTVYAHNSHYVLRLVNGERNTAMMGRLADERLPNVKYIIVDIEDLPFRESMDMAFWGMNMHDIYNRSGTDATVQFLSYIKQTLKPGGILVVSDHVGEAGNNNTELHRIEPAVMRELLLQAGFTIEVIADVMGNPEDDHTQSIYADGLRYHTDRILIRARK